MVTSGQPTHEPSIYLCPKRNSRIYFTYALLPPYFQLYGHDSRSQWVRADAFSVPKELRASARARKASRISPHISRMNRPLKLSDALLLDRKRSSRRLG